MVRSLGGILRLRHADRKVTWESLKQWCLKSLRKDRSMDRKKQTNNGHKRKKGKFTKYDKYKEKELKKIISKLAMKRVLK